MEFRELDLWPEPTEENRRKKKMQKKCLLWLKHFEDLETANEDKVKRELREVNTMRVKLEPKQDRVRVPLWLKALTEQQLAEVGQPPMDIEANQKQQCSETRENVEQ